MASSSAPGRGGHGGRAGVPLLQPSLVRRHSIEGNMSGLLQKGSPLEGARGSPRGFVMLEPATSSPHGSATTPLATDILVNKEQVVQDGKFGLGLSVNPTYPHVVRSSAGLQDEAGVSIAGTVKAGDALTHVDGVPLEGQSDSIEAFILGQRGTLVELTIQRPQGQLYSVKARRHSAFQTWEQHNTHFELKAEMEGRILQTDGRIIVALEAARSAVNGGFYQMSNTMVEESRQMIHGVERTLNKLEKAKGGVGGNQDVSRLIQEAMDEITAAEKQREFLEQNIHATLQDMEIAVEDSLTQAEMMIHLSKDDGSKDEASRLKKSLEEALRELEIWKTRALKAEDLSAQFSKENNALKESLNAAERLNKEQKEQYECVQEDLSAKVKKLGKDLESITALHVEATKIIMELTDQIKDYERSLAESNKDRDDARARARAMTEERDALAEERNAVRKSLTVAQEELESLRRKLDAANSERDAAIKKRDAYRTEKDDVTQERDALKRVHDSLLHDKELADKQLVDAYVERDENATRRDAFRNERDSVACERDHFKREFDVLTHDIEVLESKLKDTRNALDEAVAKGEFLKKDRDIVVAERDALKRDLDALRHDKEIVDKMLADTSAERDDVIKKRDTLKKERELLSSEKDAVKRELDSLKHDMDILLQKYTNACTDRDQAAQKRDAFQKQRDVVTTDRDGLRKEFDMSKMAADMLQQKLKEVEGEVELLNKKFTSVTKERDTASAKRDALKKECGKLNDERDVLQRDLDSVTQLKDSLDAKFDEVLKARDAATVKLDLLQKEKDLLGIERDANKRELGCALEDAKVANEQLSDSRHALRKTNAEIEKLTLLLVNMVPRTDLQAAQIEVKEKVQDLASMVVNLASAEDKIASLDGALRKIKEEEEALRAQLAGMVPRAELTKVMSEASAAKHDAESKVRTAAMFEAKCGEMREELRVARAEVERLTKAMLDMVSRTDLLISKKETKAAQDLVTERTEELYKSQAQVLKLSDRVYKLEKELQNLISARDALKAQQAQLETKLGGMQKMLAARDELISELEKSLRDAEALLAALRSERDSLLSRMGHSCDKTQLDEARASLQAALDKIAELERELAMLNSQNEGNQKTIEALKAEMTNLRQLLAAAQKEVHDLRSLLEDLRAELKLVKDSEASMKKKADGSSGEIEALNEWLRKKELALKDALEEIERLKAIMGGMESHDTIESLRYQLEQLKQQLQAVINDLRVSQTSLEDALRENARLRARYGALPPAEDHKDLLHLGFMTLNFSQSQRSSSVLPVKASENRVWA